MDFKLTNFYTSIIDIKNLPKYNGIEIAFTGRSNVGKSSAINTIIDKNIARTSKFPGSTKFINFFIVKNNFYLVDLPGYGYSKLSKLEKKDWKNIILEYINIRKCLKGLVLLVDIRRSVQNTDQSIIDCALKNKVSILILLTKSDKIKRHSKNIILNKNRVFFSYLSKNNIEVEFFSSTKFIGIEKLKKKIYYWFNNISY